eukprot:g5514.t1
MSDQKRDRSRSPRRTHSSGGGYRKGSERDRYGGGERDNGRRRSSGGREDPKHVKLRAVKQMLAEPAEPRSGWAKEPPEERAVELARTLESRRYLEGGSETEDVAALLVEAAGSLSMHTSVYALTTALCVSSAKSTKRSSSRERNGRDEDTTADAMSADDDVDPREDGPSFGRMVVDGCCHAFAGALRKGGFIRAKLLLRFLGELLNCGLVEAQEYGDMLTTLCAGYVTTELRDVRQPCRDMMAHMVLAGVLRVGPTLSKAWVGGFSNMMDEFRTFMTGRQAPFRLKGLRAIFVTPEDELDEEDKDERAAAEGGDRQVSQGVEPVEDSLTLLWDVVSALHDSGWHEDDMPRAILRLWKTSTIEPRLSNLSSLSLPEDFVTADTIPVELTSMGPCEIASSPGVHVGTTSPADRPDWSYALTIMGERDLFDEDDGVGPASCCPELLPKKERVVLVEYCKDTLASFQPVCRTDGTKVGKWTMLVDQLFTIRDVAPSVFQPAYLITSVLFLAMLQVPPAEHLAISCHRTILELCRSVPKEAPAAVSYCTGRLFDELERLDSSVASRFGTWFADHLKNTEYKWPFWKHWCNVVELQPDNAQRVFVSNVLSALVKLSYADRIKKTLPEALWALLPLDPTPVCPYLDGATGIPASLQRIAGDLSGRVHSRGVTKDLQAWLDGDHVLDDTQDAAGNTAEAAVDPCWRSNMLIQVLLRSGQASPTHTFVYLDRYREYLQALCRDEEMGESNQVAILDGVAQLWEHSPQWFCLVCKHLLEIGVLSPTTVVYYVFREDNSNAIALSPFLWEIMSRAISLYTDRVTLSLDELLELEKDAEASARRQARSPSAALEGADDSPHENPRDEEQRKALDEIKDQQGIVRDSVQQARTLCTTTVSSFVQALANALPQYEANGIADFSADPWWISMTSYFKASLWLFAAVPGVPMRHLADDERSGKQRILEATEVEALASSAGCQEYVEVIIMDLKNME